MYFKNFNQNDNQKEIEQLVEISSRIKESPKDPVNYIKRCKIFIKLKHFFYALEDANRLMTELTPNSTIGFRLMGEIYFLTELYEESIRILSKALEHCKLNSREQLIKMKKEAEKKQQERDYFKQKSFILVQGLAIICTIIFVFASVTINFPFFSGKSIVKIIIVSIMTGLAGYYFHFYYWKFKLGNLYYAVYPPYDILTQSQLEAILRGEISPTPCMTASMEEEEKKRF